MTCIAVECANNKPVHNKFHPSTTPTIFAFHKAHNEYPLKWSAARHPRNYENYEVGDAKFTGVPQSKLPQQLYSPVFNVH